jgi:hypothetical protein
VASRKGIAVASAESSCNRNAELAQEEAAAAWFEDYPFK